MNCDDFINSSALIIIYLYNGILWRDEIDFLNI